jgi:quinol-cytochrome oxidoreductase complex cytochrome b subunit
MSWFWGHILPGGAWLFMAIFHFLQSLHNVKYLNHLRTRPFWICFRSLFLMSCCVVGVVGELIGEWNNWQTQQNQHLTIWAGFFLSALIEYLHINNVLQDNFWCVIPPIGMPCEWVKVELVHDYHYFSLNE